MTHRPVKEGQGWEPDGQGGQTPRCMSSSVSYDAAWNLNYRTNNALVQTFGVNNLNELTTAGRSGTLTVRDRRRAPWQFAE